MNDETPLERHRREQLAPLAYALVQKADELGVMVSSLIFDPEGGFLVRVGNTKLSGPAFAKLHAQLGSIIGELDTMGAGSIVDITGAAAPGGVSAQSLADELATWSLMLPEDRVDRVVREAAQKYLEARLDG